MIWIAWAIALTASPVNLILREVGAGIEVQIVHMIVCVVCLICLISVIVYFVKNR